MEFETRAVHTGQAAEPETGATIPPIHLTTTFTQSAPGEPLAGFDYSRSGNPTRSGLEACLASLEGGEECAAFASGLAACSAVLESLRPGDGVVASHDLYGGIFRLLDKVFVPWGLEVAFAEGAGVKDYHSAIRSLRRPRLLWIETPTNPLLDVLDIEALCGLAGKHGMLSAVDSTFATPYLQRPLELGADLVVHSTTKYASGHSDVVSGAVIARRSELLEGIRFLQNAMGAVPGPLDCYLVQRGRRHGQPGTGRRPRVRLALLFPPSRLRLCREPGRRGIAVLPSGNHDTCQHPRGNPEGPRNRRWHRPAQCGH